MKIPPFGLFRLNHTQAVVIRYNLLTQEWEAISRILPKDIAEKECKNANEETGLVEILLDDEILNVKPEDENADENADAK